PHLLYPSLVSSFRHFPATCPPTSFFFPDTAPTEIYTLSLHDALPIWFLRTGQVDDVPDDLYRPLPPDLRRTLLRRLRDKSSGTSDRKSTRLNSSHVSISYAVFCLKKKKKKHYAQ